eukprot:scaffold71874_cov21-Tisochrysis_lutea.AAC.1
MPPSSPSRALRSRGAAAPTSRPQPQRSVTACPRACLPYCRTAPSACRLPRRAVLPVPCLEKKSVK